MIALDPEERVGEEEIGDLVAAVVEDQCAPVGMLAPARVVVLVEMRAVEEGEAVRIPREVGRHPVEDDPDAALMQAVDEGHEVVGGRRTAAWGRNTRCGWYPQEP